MPLSLSLSLYCLSPPLSISPSLFTPAYLGSRRPIAKHYPEPAVDTASGDSSSIVQHCPLLHSRQSRCIITRLSYALPSMRFKCTLETLRNCTESSPRLFFSFFPFSLSIRLPFLLHAMLSRLSTVLHILASSTRLGSTSREREDPTPETGEDISDAFLSSAAFHVKATNPPRAKKERE